MSLSPTDESILDKLDKIAPAALNQFDAFPKLPSTYKARSGARGFLTVLVAFISFLLVVNDVGEYIFGWPTYKFGLDNRPGHYLAINVDLVVNMPCKHLSVDLRDAVGDRLYLSDGFKRDGTLFDIGQAQALQSHTQALDARLAVAKARKSRGFFDTILRRNKDKFRPTYNYKPDGGACRVYGSIQAKKVTANLHITTAGHGYRSIHHVDHSQMNLSHVITDFSFGPYFPDMAQPLKNTFELTHEPFIAYQYFLSVVPTTYIASNGKQVHTSQYSVTHYTRVLQHEQGTPGIFFKYDLEPLQMTIHQKTTTLVQFLIRVVGVVGGVWCCAGWAFRISSKAIDVVSGADRAPGIVAAEATGASTKRKWGGGELRARVARQGNGWVVDGGSPYGSYASTPVGSAFSPNPAPFSSGGGGGGGGSSLNTPGLYSPATAPSPYARAPGSATGANGGPYGLGLNSTPGSAAMFSAGTSGGMQSFAAQQQQHLQGGVLPPTPNPYAPTPSSGFPASPNLRSPQVGSFGPSAPAPPRRDSGKDEKKMD